MRRCNHTSWLSLCSQGNGTELLVSDRVQSIINYIPDADVQRPSLLVLVGNATKTIALRELFGVKRAPRFSITRGPTEIHLHVDPSSIFGTPMLIADGDLSGKLRGRIQTDNKCHQVTRRAIREPEQELGLDTLTSRIYSQLLLPFADVFCFFCDDIGGLDRVARYLAAWPEHGHASALPASPRPKVVVVIENISLGAESEEAARTTLLRLIREETTRDLFCQISAIDVIALFPRGSISVEARLRPLKERLMASSDQIRTDRHHAQSLFSATHFAALLESACEHFSEALGKPFNFISASRAHNPVSTNLKAHLSDFLKHIKSPTELTAFAVPVIASSFLFDNYPPDAHCKSGLVVL